MTTVSFVGVIDDGFQLGAMTVRHLIDVVNMNAGCGAPLQPSDGQPVGIAKAEKAHTYSM